MGIVKASQQQPRKETKNDDTKRVFQRMVRKVQQPRVVSSRRCRKFSNQFASGNEDVAVVCRATQGNSTVLHKVTRHGLHSC